MRKSFLSKLCHLPQGCVADANKPLLLLTGASGLLGRAFIRFFERGGASDSLPWQPVVSSREGHESLTEHFPSCRIDVSDLALFAQALEELRPQYVFHAAAMTRLPQCELEPEQVMAANYAPVQLLCKHLSPETFLLFISTEYVFDGLSSVPYLETDPVSPYNKYGISKCRAEESITQSASCDWAIIRTSLVYGPSQGLSRLPIFSWARKQLSEGKTIQGVIDHWRAPIFVDDLAQTCLDIVARRLKGFFHVTGKEVLTPYEFLSQAASYWGFSPSLVQPIYSKDLKQGTKRSTHSVLNCARIEKEISYRPHTLKEALGIIDQMSFEGTKKKD